MKSYILGLVISLVFSLGSSFAAEVKTGEPKEKTAKETSSFLANVYAAPVFAWKQQDVTGDGVLGAGIDIGLKLNQFVTLSVVNLTYEEPNGWGGLAIDETDIRGIATLLSSENKRFNLNGVGSVFRDWNQEKFGLGVGLGFEWFLTKNLAAAADYSIRYRDGGEKDSLTTAGLRLSF